MLQTPRLTDLPSARGVHVAPERPRRSPLRLIVRGGLILALLLVVAITGLAALIYNGPIEVGFLRSRVQATMERAFGAEFTVEVGATTIGLDPLLGLMVEVRDLVVADSAGGVVAAVPATRMAVDPLALLTLRVAITSVEISDATISLVQARTAFRLGTPASGAPEATPEPAAAAAAAPVAAGPVGGGFAELTDGAQFLDRGVTAAVLVAESMGFRRFSLLGGIVDVYDSERGTTRRFSGGEVTVAHDDASGAVNLAITASGYAGRWTASAERAVDPVTGDRQLSVVFSQLALADLFPAFGAETGPFATDIPLYGRAVIGLSAAGDLTSAMARLDLGAGAVHVGAARTSILLDEATIRLNWDIPNDLLVLEPSTFYFGQSRAMLGGWVRPAGEPGGHRYAFSIEGRNAILAPRDSPAAPVVAREIGVAGEADLDARLLQVSEARILLEDGGITASGSIGLEGRSPSVAVVATISPMPIDTIKQIWPPFVVPGARRWLLDNVVEGRIAGGQFRADLPAGLMFDPERKPIPADALMLNFELENIGFRTYGDLPTVRGASGAAVLAGTTFGLDVMDGQIVLPSGRSVTLTAGAFAIPHILERNQTVQIEAQLAGDAQALAELANSEPIHALEGRDINPADLSGSGTARISAKWSMRPELTMADVDWTVAAQATDFASRAPIVGRRIDEGAMSLTVNREAVTIRGRAEVDGLPANLDLSFPMTPGGDLGDARQQVRLVIDDAARRRLGMGLEGMLAGTVTATMSDLGAGHDGQHYVLDLKDARVTVAPLGWSKGIGVPATLTVDMVADDRGYRLENLVIEGPGFGLAGSARLDEDYGIVSADISRFSLRRGDSLSFTLRRANAGYAIDAEGSSFDVRGMVAGLLDAAESPEGAPELSVAARIGTLIGFNEQNLTGSDFALRAGPNGVDSIRLAGRLNAGRVEASYSGAADGGIDLFVEDTGAALKFLDFYTRIDGGRLTVTGRSGANGVIGGQVDLVNFAIVDEPAMERLLSGSRPNEAPGANLNPNRVVFERMMLNFGMRGSQMVFNDGLFRGVEIGATWSGAVDFASSRLQLAGTYLPAYRFNNIFGQIPLLGLALGGGEREGLLGVTFKVEGSFNDLHLTINPLSAIAPGIFRKIFEFP